MRTQNQILMLSLSKHEGVYPLFFSFKYSLGRSSTAMVQRDTQPSLPA